MSIEPADELIGQQVDQYVIQAHLNRGGMADVYLAFDTRLKRQAALKLLLPHLTRDASYVARFQREAETAAQLQHPHLIQIYNVGVGPGERPYIAMPYVQGGSLLEWLGQLKMHGQQMPVLTALRLGRQIAAALAAAHAAGVIHRDLKPANVLLGSSGEAIVTDLGVAVVKTADTRLTITGHIVGTLAYMSPEQRAGLEVDARADIYALGVMLHEMLAGGLPGTADLPDSLSEATWRIVQTCLASSRADRYQTASALMEAIDEAMAVEKGAGPVRPTPTPAAEPAGSARWLLALLPLTLLLLCFSSYQIFLFLTPATPLPTRIPVENPVVELGTPTPTLIFSPTPPPSPVPTATGTPPPTETPASTDTPSPTPFIFQSAVSSPPPPVLQPVPPSGRIVFTCFIDGVDDLCSINSDGSDYRRLTAVNATDFYASFAPGGQQIYFSSRREGQFLMYAMNADGSEPRRVGPTHVGGIYAPAVSPDGQRVAFTAASAGQQHIWVLDLVSGQLTQLTRAGVNNVDAVWSPDGSQIAFASDREGELAHYVMGLDGDEDARRVTGGVDQIGGRSDWSPDGRWLAFYAGPRNDRNIYLAAIDGSVIYQLTQGGSNLAPSFSPDGNWLAFTSYRTGNAEIFIMRIDGSGATQLTFNDYADWQPRWSR